MAHPPRGGRGADPALLFFQGLLMFSFSLVRAPVGKSVWGALLSLAAFTVWATSDALSSLAGKASFPIASIAVISSFANVIFFVAVFGLRGKLRQLLPVSWKKHFFLAGLSSIQIFFNVTAFTCLPMTNVYVGLFLSPMAISVLAALLLHEPLRRGQIVALAVGFGGVLIALGMGSASVGPDAAKGYGALVFYVAIFILYMLSLRLFGRTETAASLAFFPTLLRCLFLLPVFLWNPGLGGQAPVFGVVMMGVLSGLGFLLISKAYQKAAATIVASFHYSQIITGGVLGYVIWGQKPSAALLCGAVLIILSGLATLRLAQKQDRASCP